MADEKFKKIRDFYFPVLHIIQDMGGKARVKDISDRFLARHKEQMDSSFFTDIKDGDVKWHDYVNRAGYQLRVKGYITRPTTGLWEMTDKPWPANKEDL
jgi:hypothetical protein